MVGIDDENIAFANIGKRSPGGIYGQYDYQGYSDYNSKYSG
jgi:hypothetical protein